MMLRIVLMAVTLVLGMAAAQASETPRYGAAPAWVQPAPAPDAAATGDAAPVLVIADQQSRIADGQRWSYFDVATRIASTEVMNEAGTINIAWQPDAGDIILHRAEILRGIERIDLVARGARLTVLRREAQLESYQVTGILNATLTVDGLRIGDVLRVSYSTTERDRALGGNVQLALPLITAPMRVGFARTLVSWPERDAITWRVYPQGARTAVTTRGGFSEVAITLPLAAAPELPADAPLRFRPFPVVEATSFRDWAMVSRTMAPLYATEGTIAPGSALAGEVARIRAAETDPLKRTALALRLVQDQIRYLFNGMAGGHYVPQTPARTWEVRYGDCKAKTLLLLAILRELGITAEAALAHITLGDLVPGRVPSPGAFDHVIVRATIGDTVLWLDGTGSGTRIDDLADIPPFRHVLPIRPAGATPIALAPRAIARPEIDLMFDLDQTAGLMFPTPFTMTAQLRGRTAQILKVAATQANDQQKDQFITSLMARIFSNTTITGRDIRYEEASGTATIIASGLMESPWVRRDGRYRMILDRTMASVTFEPDRARAAWQAIPVATGNPGLLVVRLRTRLPGAGAGIALEGDQALPPVLAGVQVSRSVSMSGGLLVVEDRIAATGGEIAPAAVAAARAAVALAKTRPLTAVAPAGYPPRHRQLAMLDRSRAFAAMLARYDRMIANETTRSQGYADRAAFQLSIYEYRAALADQDRLIAIEPSADNHEWRGDVRLAIGDRAGAIADFEAAHRLDPGDADVVSALAMLYGRSGRVPEALALADARIAQGGRATTKLRLAKAEILADSGKADEAIALLDRALVETPGNADLLNGQCWIKGTRNVALDTALRDCTRAIELATSPESALDSRAMVYVRMRRFDEALADLDAALNADPDQAASLYLRGLVRRMQGNRAAGDIDLADARLISPDIDADYARFGLRP